MRSNDLQINNPISTAVGITITSETDYVGVTNTDSARTIVLPPAASVGRGKVIVIKDESGAAGTNNITADGSGNETIDGATTKAIATNYGYLRLYCTGTAWFTI